MVHDVAVYLSVTVGPRLETRGQACNSVLCSCQLDQIVQIKLQFISALQDKTVIC